MKKRLLAVGISTALGIAAFGAPTAAISEAGCESLSDAQGFITVKIVGSRLDQLLGEIGAEIDGEGPPQVAIFVPRIQLPNECLKL